LDHPVYFILIKGRGGARGFIVEELQGVWVHVGLEALSPFLKYDVQKPK